MAELRDYTVDMHARVGVIVQAESAAQARAIAATEMQGMEPLGQRPVVYETETTERRVELTEVSWRATLAVGGPEGFDDDSVSPSSCPWRQLEAATSPPSSCTVRVQVISPEGEVMEPAPRGEAMNSLMKWDHLIRIGPGGHYCEPEGIVAPDAYFRQETGGVSLRGGVGRWRMLHGYSDLHGDSGPLMHLSEFIGRQMADHIRSTPGLYVALPAHLDSSDGGPVGWVVAYQLDNPDS